MTEVASLVELEPKSHPLPEIVEVSKQKFEELISTHPDAENIGMYETKDIPNDRPTINRGAGPCLIMWEFDANEGVMKRSCHYPEVNDKRYNRFTKQAVDQAGNYGEELNKRFEKEGLGSDEIALPKSDGQIHYLSSSPTPGYRAYIETVENVGQDAKTPGADIHIYLFGQNGVVFNKEPERSETIVKYAIEQHDVIHQFTKAGAREKNIHDYRSPDRGGGDNTYYNPEENKLYYYHRE